MHDAAISISDLWLSSGVLGHFRGLFNGSGTGMGRLEKTPGNSQSVDNSGLLYCGQIKRRIRQCTEKAKQISNGNRFKFSWNQYRQCFRVDNGRKKIKRITSSMLNYARHKSFKTMIPQYSHNNCHLLCSGSSNRGRFCSLSSSKNSMMSPSRTTVPLSANFFKEIRQTRFHSVAFCKQQALK